MKSEKEGPEPNAGGPQTAPARVMSRQMSVQYANCAMVATSPRDISLFFGRYVPGADEKGSQKLVELYETQIYMTLAQAEDLARILSQTVTMIKSGKRPETSQ
jgi:hypothetical protein